MADGERVEISIGRASSGRWILALKMYRKLILTVIYSPFEGEIKEGGVIGELEPFAVMLNGPQLSRE